MHRMILIVTDYTTVKRMLLRERQLMGYWVILALDSFQQRCANVTYAFHLSLVDAKLLKNLVAWFYCTLSF